MNNKILFLIKNLRIKSILLSMTAYITHNYLKISDLKIYGIVQIVNRNKKQATS